jgi:glycosyltransferase involved in cell wall biosynthesis
MSTKSVVIISRAWYPNHQILFDKLSVLLAEKNIIINYLLLHAVENDRPWKIGDQSCLVNPRVLVGKHITIFGKEIMFGHSISNELNILNPSLVILTPWSEFSLFIAKRWALYNKKPCIVWLMGPRAYSWSIGLIIRSYISKFLLKSFVSNVDLIFSYGNGVKLKISQLTNFDTKKIINVKHSVDDKLYSFNSYRDKLKARLAFRQMYGLCDKQLLFGYVGQLSSRKGIINLLLACEHLWIEGFHFKLFVLGNGPLQNELNFYKTKWSDNIFQVSSTEADNLKNIYSAFDLVVVPSLFDDWCTVINEAFHAGVPVIASNGAYATLDLVIDGFNGYSYEGFDWLSLKSKLELVLLNTGQLVILGSNAQDYITSNWTIDMSAQIWFKHIVSLLKVQKL